MKTEARWYQQNCHEGSSPMHGILTLKRPDVIGTDKPKPTPPTGNALIVAVAMALEARGSQMTRGMENIEDRGFADVLTTPVADTVFAMIAEELEVLHVDGDLSTVGGVVHALGIGVHTFPGARGRRGRPITSADAIIWGAHCIGCHCHGDEISTASAAARVRSFTTGG